MNLCRPTKIRRDNQLKLRKKVKGNFSDLLFRRQTKLGLMPSEDSPAVRINPDSQIHGDLEARIDFYIKQLKL